ncbi:MAG: bifunctional transaldolase/phosoglucose isomerase [Chloroflexota bacterium]|jgi:transaldolase/glucose-6-phosphate isomerase
MSNIEAMNELGQSVWLNYLRRAFIHSGELSDAIEAGIRGITSTPLIFEKAITDSADYDRLLQDLVTQGIPVKEIYQALVVDDIQRAADVLHPIFETSEGLDGYVTVELNPALANDAVGTIAEARHVLALANRSNVMVEIPATEAGISAIETLTSDGVNVNATHIFSIETYEKVAQAYLKGIEEYIDTHSVWRQMPSSVASISLSRIDTKVDAILDQKALELPPGWAAISLAKILYRRFSEIFSGPTWQSLQNRGALVQRPKWTRTTTRDFRYPDTYYVEALIGPDTVTTFSPVTFNAILDHGQVDESLTKKMDQADAYLQELAELGIDLNVLGQELQAESLEGFDKYYQALIQSVTKRRDELEQDWHRMTSRLGQYKPVVEEAQEDLFQNQVIRRIWSHDHTVWKPEPDEITNRLGWLHVVETMLENLDRLRSFAEDVVEDGIANAVVLGMGGSSLAPELYAKTFSPWMQLNRPEQPSIELSILDTTDPDTISALCDRLKLDKTLFIVASKSGSTVETLSTFRYFYNQVLEEVGQSEAGRHFVSITDPGTGLVDISKKFRFREIFLNDPNIGGRYAALSYFGLVPAALVGLDLEMLLNRALAMAVNANSCNRPPEGDNVAAKLGTILGELAKDGRDKLTIITSPPINSFGDWAEQLIAESTGKAGTGILPVVGESLGPAEVYGSDRLFVYLRLDGTETYDKDVEVLSAAGFPVVIMNLKDIYDIGGMFFTWEMATAVTGYYLGIQPFNQPNVEAAKKLAKSMVAEYKETGQLPAGESGEPRVDDLEEFLNQGKLGDYVAIQAYLQPTAQTDKALEHLRTTIRDRYHLPATVGYGPRYLHSTGQLHKGDKGNGLFIQFESDSTSDVPIPDVAGHPDSQLTFGVLIKAQMLGDGQALEEAKRRLIRFDLGTDVTGGLERLTAGLSSTS